LGSSGRITDHSDGYSWSGTADYGPAGWSAAGSNQHHTTHHAINYQIGSGGVWFGAQGTGTVDDTIVSYSDEDDHGTLTESGNYTIDHHWAVVLAGGQWLIKSGDDSVSGEATYDYSWRSRSMMAGAAPSPNKPLGGGNRGCGCVGCTGRLPFHETIHHSRHRHGPLRHGIAGAGAEPTA
jgi:hypothetical protein